MKSGQNTATVMSGNTGADTVFYKMKWLLKYNTAWHILKEVQGYDSLNSWVMFNSETVE